MPLLRRLTASLCLLLMIPGCGPGSGAVEWTAPVTVDLAATRCPDISPRDRAEFRRGTPPPKPDTVGADGKPAISRGAWKNAGTALLKSEDRKNATGQRIIDEYDACRGSTTPTS